MSRFHRPATILCILLLAAVFAANAGEAEIDIPYTKYVLDNGLTLLVHEDHAAPIVAVNIWYHVGSKNEKVGKTGFAHLFEHIMFNGSENYDQDYFEIIEAIGATTVNGTTNEDRTNYFQTVPVSALDRVLWLESDRMGHLLGAVTQEKLDTQIGVVQNEKREFENGPYAVTEELIALAAWPKGHPYDHTIIGSMEDLASATLDDIHTWFKTYYGPSNAVLAIAGDVDPEEALERVKHYFGDIPPGPPVAHFQDWVAKRTGEQRQKVQDRVPQARVYKIWNVPAARSADVDQLELVADILASGKTSRLYKRLVYEEQIASGVAAYLDDREVASLFVVHATAKPGQDLARIEAILDEEMGRFLKDGPTEAEVKRVSTAWVADFVRGLESLGGFGGKSDILARNAVFAGDPEHYKVTLGRVRSATPAGLHEVSKSWLSDGVYALEVTPFPDLAAAEQGASRATMPEMGDPPEPRFPAIQRTTLSNGLQVMLASRHDVPVVEMSLLVDAGYASDRKAPAGTAQLAMNMLDEGTTTHSALEIADREASLGANLGAGSGLDTCTVALSALKENLSESLDLFADVVLNPAFPQKELDRLKKQQHAQIQAEKSAPFPMALRVFPKLMYGEDHAYGQPFSGSGTEASLEKITRDELVKFHTTWFRPNNATLVVAGDTTLDELTPLLEARFKGWKKGKVPEKNVAEVSLPEKPTVYIMDRPGSIQSLILGGYATLPKANPDEVAVDAMNEILGGAFTSRINMNIREDKHWAYGAHSVIVDARGPRPFVVYAPVQADKTKESIIELTKELTEVLGDRPITSDELAKVKDNEVLALSGSWETNGQVLGALSDMVEYGYPDDWYETYPGKVTGLDLDDVNGAAAKVVHPDSVFWLVVGDRAKIEAGIRELGLDDIRLIDVDGNVL